MREPQGPEERGREYPGNNTQGLVPASTGTFPHPHLGTHAIKYTMENKNHDITVEASL